MPTPHSKEKRAFLQKAQRLLGLAALGSLLYPLLRFTGFHLPAQPIKVTIRKNLLPNGFFVHKDFVLFNHPDKPIAVSRRCTHLGCRLNLNENEKRLICPCHQSAFDLSGKRLAGPAQRDLPSFPVEKLIEDGTTIYVVSM